MATTSKTLLDLLHSVGFAVRDLEPYIEDMTNPDAKVRHFVRCVNEVIRRMARAKPSPMLDSSVTLRTYIDDSPTTSTIALTVSTGLMTGVGTAFLSDVGTGGTEVGRVILFKGTAGTLKQMNDVPSRVERVASDTQAYLKKVSRLTGDNMSASGVTWSVLQDVYPLPGDVMRVVDVSLTGYNSATMYRKLICKSPSEIEYIRHTIRGNQSDNTSYQSMTQGTPMYWALVGLVDEHNVATAGRRKWGIMVDPFPDSSDYALHVKYVATPLHIDPTAAIDSSVTLQVPDDGYSTLVQGVVALWNQTVNNSREYDAWRHTALPRWATGSLNPTDSKRSSISVSSLMPRSLQ